MDVIVRDIVRSDAMRSLRLIAGGGGLDRPVSKVGILDFEFTRTGSQQCIDDHWVTNEFVLSTFLYARDNADLLTDAVKRIASCRTSGLAIKNVFSLEISNEAIRYADTHGYPLFLFTDHSLFFEDVIVTVNEMIKAAADGNEMERKLSAIINGSDDKNAIKQAALEVNYAFRNSFFAAYFSLKAGAEKGQLAALISRGTRKSVIPQEVSILRYGDGFFLIHSADDAKSIVPEEEVAKLANKAGFRMDDFCVGISDLQYFLVNFKKALRQSLYAARYGAVSGDGVNRHRDMGVYRLLYPVLEEEWLGDYYDSLMAPIIEHDAENRTNLLEVAMAYEYCGGSVKKTALRIGMHENTVRYRLARICELLGYAGLQDVTDDISLAVKVHRIRQIERKNRTGEVS